MNKSYEVAKILTPKERKHLLALKQTCVTLEAHQDYNLFDVSKTFIHPKHLGMYTNKFSPIARTALDKLASEAATRMPQLDLQEYSADTIAQYFLDYTENGFTKFHTDDDERVGLTMVTILDQQDLSGGETLLMREYELKERPAHKYAKRSEKQGPYGQRIIPEVVPMEVGDTIIYNRNLMHGVGKVREGIRTVLVTWYRI